jgi:hypothetical protein
MKKNIDRDALIQHWVHSHEEDTATETVFRPVSFAFPRSRGRSAMVLKPDGGLVETGPDPTDRPQESQGTWTLEGEDILSLNETEKKKPKRTLKIVSLDKDRLVVRKLKTDST